MAQAMAAGFVRAGRVAAADVTAADPSEAARAAFAQRVPGCQTTASGIEAVGNADLVLLAVKPQIMDSVLTDLAGHITADHLVVSIAAGVRIERIEQALGEATRIIRVMPNTPCLVGLSASGFSLGSQATPVDGELVAELLEAVGFAVPVEESLLDAVTGVSGSGPAFVYRVIDALRAGGVQMGLSDETALKLAAHTVRGAAEMVLSTGESPETLTQRVCSPGGTTLAGLAAFDTAEGSAALVAAVEAATRRSVELGQPS